MYQHAAGRLLANCEKQKFLGHLASEKDIILRLLTPMTQQFYDALTIVNILSVIFALLDMSPSSNSSTSTNRASVGEVNRPPSLKKDLIHLKDTWKTSIEKSLGPMTVWTLFFYPLSCLFSFLPPIDSICKISTNWTTLQEMLISFIDEKQKMSTPPYNTFLTKTKEKK